MKEEPIRILHVLQRMEPAGVQTLLMNIYKNIDRQKVQFDFLVHYKEKQLFDSEIEKMGGKIYRLSVREDFNFIKYIKNLNEFFSEHKEYRIVHGHMHSLGWIYLKIAKKYNIKVRIAHSHTNNTQHDKKFLIKNISNHLFSKYATDLFACSEEAGKYMFKNKKFEVINNGIDSENFKYNDEYRKEIRKELKINEDEILIGNVGRFEKQKNQLFVIEIFKKFLELNPNSKLLFVGKGSMENEIKQKVSDYELNNKVIFLKDRKDINKIYCAMDAFLFPSIFEGLGIVCVEAQCAGTPVICTDTLPKELNLTPIIYRCSLNDEISKWNELINNAITNNKTHKDMTQNIIEQGYDIKSIAKKLESYYIKKWNE